MPSHLLAACVLLSVLGDSTAVEAGKGKGRGASVPMAGAAKGKGKGRGAGSAGAKGRGTSMTPLAARANTQRLLMVKWLCTGEERPVAQKMVGADMFQCKFKDYLSQMKSMNEQADQKKELVDKWVTYAKAHRDKQAMDYWKMYDLFCAAKPPPQGADAICSATNTLFAKAREQSQTPAGYLVSTGAAKAGGKGGGKKLAGGR